MSRYILNRKEYKLEEDEISSTKLLKDPGTNLANDIYFYSEIFPDTAFLVNKAIRDLEKIQKIVQINLDLPKPPPIKIYINSPGGDVQSAFSIVDLIKRCTVPVYTYVEGSVASAATLVSMSGKKRFISTNAVMMLHQISSWFQGTYENHMDERKNLDMMMTKIKNYYTSNSKIPMEELEELLKHDIDLSAEDCLKYGFVDTII